MDTTEYFGFLFIEILEKNNNNKTVAILLAYYLRVPEWSRSCILACIFYFRTLTS